MIVVYTTHGFGEWQMLISNNNLCLIVSLYQLWIRFICPL